VTPDFRSEDLDLYKKVPDLEERFAHILQRPFLFRCPNRLPTERFGCSIGLTRSTSPSLFTTSRYLNNGPSDKNKVFIIFFWFVNWRFLKTWMGAPSIYVYDCNNAGIIVESFKTFAEQHEREYAEQIRNIHSQGGSPDIQPPTSLR
jgi:hypothetical protein